MLNKASICADVATHDLKRAREFYEKVLGLKPLRIDAHRGVYYRTDDGTMLNLYERQHTPAEQTVATFLVEDIAETMAELRRSDVTFEEYDEPDLKTDKGVFSDGSGFKVCWFKDPDGNVLSLEQLS
ncbi:MAG: VOC family protein [Myxococcales bacterium]|nr:VOC family protein [Myxococcales bacterium]